MARRHLYSCGSIVDPLLRGCFLSRPAAPLAVTKLRPHQRDDQTRLIYLKTISLLALAESARCRWLSRPTAATPVEKTPTAAARLKPPAVTVAQYILLLLVLVFYLFGILCMVMFKVSCHGSQLQYTLWRIPTAAVS